MMHLGSGRFASLYACILCVSASANAQDQPLPLWEAGLGGGGVYGPVYPGSEHRTVKGLGVPYVIYRGKTLRIGDGGFIRAMAMQTERLQIDVSINGSFSADSSEDPAREGMPDLDFLFEVGPRIKYRLKRFDFARAGRGELELRGKARAVFSLRLDGLKIDSIDDRGFVFEPEISHTLARPFDLPGRISLSVTPTFATRRLQEYFYSVPQRYERTSRPAYKAEGGYLGTSFRLGVGMRPHRRVNLFLGTRISLYHGAANENSPLLRDQVGVAVSFGAVLRLWESQRRAAEQQQ